MPPEADSPAGLVAVWDGGPKTRPTRSGHCRRDACAPSPPSLSSPPRHTRGRRGGCRGLAGDRRSRSSCSVMPSARLSTSSVTQMRVPRMTGRPKQTSGSMMMCWASSSLVIAVVLCGEYTIGRGRTSCAPLPHRCSWARHAVPLPIQRIYLVFRSPQGQPPRGCLRRGISGTRCRRCRRRGEIEDSHLFFSCSASFSPASPSQYGGKRM